MTHNIDPSLPDREVDEYSLAMGVPSGGHHAPDERYAYGSHKDELTGDLARARDSYARAAITKAAAEHRQRQAGPAEADREAGA